MEEVEFKVSARLFGPVQISFDEVQHRLPKISSVVHCPEEKMVHERPVVCKSSSDHSELCEINVLIEYFYL